MSAFNANEKLHRENLRNGVRGVIANFDVFKFQRGRTASWIFWDGFVRLFHYTISI